MSEEYDKAPAMMPERILSLKLIIGSMCREIKTAFFSVAGTARTGFRSLARSFASFLVSGGLMQGF